MEWKVDISGITGASIERANVEAQRAIAEQLETLNKNMALRPRIEQLEELVQHYENRIEDLEKHD